MTNDSAAKAQPVTYHRLTPGARAEIQWAGFTVADYIRAFDPDGQWHGDRCGCPDSFLRDGVTNGYLGWTR